MNLLAPLGALAACSQMKRLNIHLTQELGHCLRTAKQQTILVVSDGDKYP